MTDYNAPLDDIRFCIRQLGGLKETLALDAYEGVDADDVDQILEEAARFAHDVVAPTNTIGDEEGCSVKDGKVVVPDEFASVYQQFVENGWQAIGGSPEFDGMGLPATVALAAAEMWQSSNMALSLVFMLSKDAAEAIEAHGSDELKNQYLSKIISGEWSATMNLTEPQAGSDLSVVSTRAERDGNQFRIRGTKIYITWGDHELADNVIHLVLARIDGAPEGTRGISMFLVPKYLPDDAGNPGEKNDVYAASVEHKLGIHASPTCVMNFGENEGALGYLVGEENKGLAAMFTMMNHARIEVGLQGVAISERALQLARSYANDRIQGCAPGQKKSGPIIHHPDVRRMLMLMRSQIEAMRALVYTAAACSDVAHHAGDADARAAADRRLAVLTPVVKGWLTETALEITSLGVQIHGGMGFVEETGAAQYLRDARILTIYEGTSGIQAGDFAGRKILSDDGREIHALIKELREQSRTHDAAIDDKVQHSLTELENAADWLVANATSDINTTGSASFNLLMGAGITFGGALLARSVALLGDAGVSSSFASTKTALTAFYCNQVLPRAQAYLDAATSDPAVTMAIDPNAL